MKLATFDIFDTALLRRCGAPDNAIYLLAKRLFGGDDGMRHDFVRWRLRAPRIAAAQAGHDPSLDEIYRLAGADLYGDSHSVAAMVAAEREVEAAELTANPAVRELIRAKRQAGYTIAFVSDMHLDSHFLKEILVREGCAEEGDAVYVSCEHNARKDTGTLYDLVRRLLHPDRWEHYGDNRHSDCRIARRKGIKAQWIDTRPNPAEAETSGAGSMMRDATATARLANASRLHRLRHGDDPYSTIAADFVAPAYLPYLFFVLGEARRRGIKRLYFLSRDSYVLLRGAKAIRQQFPDIELRYLFVSRRSLLLPYLCGAGREAYLAISDHHTIVRIDSIYKRLSHLGTTRQEMRERWGIEFAYDRAMNLSQQEDFLGKVFDSEFAPTLQQRAAEQERLLVDYFRQEGLMDGEKIAAVDVGWLGTSRLMINTLLRRHGCADMEFFYYGVRGDVFPSSAGRYTTYFSNGTLSTATTGLIEHYYSASPYPTTVGYRREEDGRIAPMFPKGECVQETMITTANTKAVEEMAAELLRQGLTDEQALYLWANSTIRLITTGNTPIDFAPLVANSQFDNAPFVKRLSAVELVRLVVLGQQVTAFDRASIRVTLPRPLQGLAWRLHGFTSRTRIFLYRRLIANR